MVIGFILMPFWAFLIILLVGFFVSFISSWASFAHLLSLSIIGPFSNSVFHGLLLTPLGFTSPITLSFISWAFHQPLTFFTCITSGLLWPILTFLHYILPMGLQFLSLRVPLGPFASSRPICLFYGPMIHYSCHLDLMGFFYLFTNSSLPILLGFFLLLGFPKWTLTLILPNSNVLPLSLFYYIYPP